MNRILINTTWILILISMIFPLAISSAGCGVAKDTQLQMKIKDELAKDRNVQADKITVNVKRGVVTVSGELYTQEEIDRAVEIISGVEGVETVNNLLKLPDTFGSQNPTMLYPF
jgi:hypothetical protein